MVVNGFNINDYRYFKNIKTGEVYKYNNDMLNSYLFKFGYKGSILGNSLNVKFPKDKPFDLIEFIKIQKPITFNSDGFEDFSFDENDYLIMTKWFNDRIFVEDISINLPFMPSEKIILYNQKLLNLIENCKTYDMNLLDKSSFLIPLLTTNNNDFNLSKVNSVYKLNYSQVKFRLPFKAGEKWDLSKNIGLLFLFINQKFISSLYNCYELLGEEKEAVFYQDYKDNIPNTAIRYYKLNGSKDFYRPNHGVNFALECCRYNKNNFDGDGNVLYCFFKGIEYASDYEDEKFILKYATRLSQEEAIKKYNEDLEAEVLHFKEEESLKYVQEHWSTYNKPLNRILTPLEFMEKEQKKERDYSIKRLVKVLHNVEDLKR